MVCCLKLPTEILKFRNGNYNFIVAKETPVVYIHYLNDATWSEQYLTIAEMVDKITIPSILKLQLFKVNKKQNVILNFSKIGRGRLLLVGLHSNAPTIQSFEWLLWNRQVMILFVLFWIYLFSGEKFNLSHSTIPYLLLQHVDVMKFKNNVIDMTIE